MKTIKPNTEKIQQFLIWPLIFSVGACAFSIASLGLNIGALLTCVVILGIILVPFLVFVLPVFLFEKIEHIDSSLRFYFVFLVFRFHRTISVNELMRIEEQYRERGKSGHTVFRFITEREEVTISTAKYRRNHLLDLIHTLKKRNHRIQIQLIS